MAAIVGSIGTWLGGIATQAISYFVGFVLKRLYKSSPLMAPLAAPPPTPLPPPPGSIVVDVPTPAWANKLVEALRANTEQLRQANARDDLYEVVVRRQGWVNGR